MEVTADMLVSDVLNDCPGAIRVFERHGLACSQCLAAGMESLSSAAVMHDLSLSELMNDLNRAAGDDCLPREEP